MKEYRNWLKKSEENLDNAEYMLKDERFEGAIFFFAAIC